MLPANALAPWLSVAPPVETTFLLLQQTWPLVAGWLALIVLSIRSDRRQGPPGAAQPEALQGSERNAAAATGNASFAAQRVEWIRQKEAEQTEEQRVDQLSLHRRMLAEGGLWGSLSIAFVFLLGALAVFCVALGTPVIGGLSAQSLLSAFGCFDQSQMASNPWSGLCGFWVDRLEPYQRPWLGALFSPIWLFTQFSDVLLIWLSSILVLALLPVYRVGWSMVLKNTSPLVKTGWVIVFSAALLGQLYELSSWNNSSSNTAIRCGANSGERASGAIGGSIGSGRDSTSCIVPASCPCRPFAGRHTESTGRL